MRPLVIGPEERIAIRKSVAYAMEPEHFYSVGAPWVPGDNPNYVTLVPIGFRCVFAITKHGGKLFRHLSVSVPDEDRRPSPEAIVMLAREYGFTASDDALDLVARMERDRWLVSAGHDGGPHIVAIQPID